jgi:threonine dehydrogenase-like Zn-dependent dehydrogenase
VPGVYGGFLDKIPFGSVLNRAITLKTGQTHVQRYMGLLLKRVQDGDIDPSFVVTHRLPLEQAPEGYRMFRDKQDRCVKIVLKPGMTQAVS